MFDVYAVMLMVSGVLLIINALLPWQTTGGRVVSILFGLGFLGYGFYLEFIFTGGEYRIFVYAFIVPVLVLITSIKGYAAWRAQKTQQPAIYPGAQIPAQYPPAQYPPAQYPPAQYAPAQFDTPVQHGQPPQFGQPQPGQAQYGQYPPPNPVQPQ